jgi:hypothetical protein
MPAWSTDTLLVGILAVLLFMAYRQHAKTAPNNPAAAALDAVQRDQLARLVISISGFGLVVVSIVVIAVSWLKADDPSRTSTMVFNSLVPLLGTWVGTVIAFYFSSSNYKAAADGVRDLVQQLTPDQKLASVPVSRAMVPRSRMTVIRLATTANAAQAAIDAAAAAINLRTDVIALLQDPVTRVPVLDQNDVALYIIHESVLYQYASVPDAPPAVPAAAARTLSSFLNYQGMRDRASNTKAFVSASASLADAKGAMGKVAGCQDVFVTQSGQATDPVMGWLTNVDILNYSKS